MFYSSSKISRVGICFFVLEWFRVQSDMGRMVCSFNLRVLRQGLKPSGPELIALQPERKKGKRKRKRIEKRSNKCIATSNKCLTTSNKCHASSNKKLAKERKGEKQRFDRYARYLGIDPVADHDLLWIAVEVRCRGGTA